MVEVITLFLMLFIIPSVAVSDYLSFQGTKECEIVAIYSIYGNTLDVREMSDGGFEMINLGKASFFFISESVIRLSQNSAMIK